MEKGEKDEDFTELGALFLEGKNQNAWSWNVKSDRDRTEQAGLVSCAWFDAIP